MQGEENVAAPAEKQPSEAEQQKSPPTAELSTKSIYKGVFKCGKKFKAQIQTNRVQHYLGLFDTELEAARAYDNHARVVLGPKARTNFEYNHAVPPEPVVMVAPLFVRSDANRSSSMGAQSMAGKRSYVGIKMKRKALLEKNNSGEKRFKGNPNSLTTHLIQQFGLGGVVGLDPSEHTSQSSTATSVKGNGNGSGPSSATSTSSSSAPHPAPLSTSSPSAMASMLSLSEEQRRFFEQYPHLRPAPQPPQAPYYMPPYSHAPPGQYPYMMPYSTGMPPSSQPVAPYMPGGYAMPHGAMQYPYPQPFPYSHPSQGPAGGGYFPSLMPHMMLPSGAAGANGHAPMPYMGGYPSLPAAHMSAAPAASGALARDQSTIEAAAQLGRLMTMAPQDLSADNGGSGKTGTSAAATAAATATVAVSPRGGASSQSSATPPATASRSASDARVVPAVSSDSADGPTDTRTSSSGTTERGARLDGAGEGANEIPGNQEDEEDEEEELDWREQLYYWTGLLYFDPARGMQVWKGSWVGSYTGKPQPEEFSWSFNHFEYTTPVSRSAVSPEGVLIEPQSGDLRGFYLMDNDGSGALERYEDTEYTIEFEKSTASRGPGVPLQYAVYGRGDSDFGAFIVSGVLNKQTMVLEMTRRYVAETDDRSHMSIAQLKELFKSQDIR